MIYPARIVWDIPTRVFHWTLASCVILNLFMLEEGDAAHEWTGYIAVFTVALRLFWGFFSAPASRLKSFPIHPRSIYFFARNFFSDSAGTYEGHNPLASLVYISIWACIFGLGISGWMMGLDAFWGEDWVEELHGAISNGLQILIGIHLLGVLIDSLRYKRHTWAGMIIGKKEQ